jgi:lysophospholipase L1-like esterase
VLAALVCVPATVTTTQAADPVRILVVGDSITQGSAGDWTWRYRLWKHLTDHGVAVDLVGPRTDLYDNVASTFGSQAYLDPGFDRDHASRWGMRLGSLDVPIATLVSTYHPDVLLELLGDNDLSDGKTPAQVSSMLQGLVDQARAADPAVDVVLGQDPRPQTQPSSSALNALIAQLAAQLDTPGSRVVATNAAGYDDLQDTWDGAHPNARGELKIAAQFENALHQMGTAFPVADPVPAVPLGPRIPPVLSAALQQETVTLEWVRSPGSQKSDVWERDVTAGEAWHRVAADVSGLAHTVTGVPDGHQVQFQTRPYKGFLIAEPDAWSNVVQVPVLAPAPVVPGLTAPAPVTGVRVRRDRRGRLRASGKPVAVATSYTLRAAPAASCDHAPRDRRFRVVATGVSRPAARFRLDGSAVWVRWTAVRDGVESGLGPGSTACLRR